MGLQAIQYYYGLNEQERAHKHLKILADALYDRLVFYSFVGWIDSKINKDSICNCIKKSIDRPSSTN
jgi:hypothetical protein